MYLSNRDIKWAIESGQLIVTPRPDFDVALGPTSLDLRLDSVDSARWWDENKYKERNQQNGKSGNYELNLEVEYEELAAEFLKPIPTVSTEPVHRRGNEVVIRQGGFFIWQTKEFVGTPPGSNLIGFVEGRSKIARSGLLVHLAAPIIHTTWKGQIILEIHNVGPFDFVLREDDYVVQLTVATVTSTPDKTSRKKKKETKQA